MVGNSNVKQPRVTKIQNKNLPTKELLINSCTLESLGIMPNNKKKIFAMSKYYYRKGKSIISETGNVYSFQKVICV